MKRNTLAKAERKFLLISAVLVALLGVPTILGFMAQQKVPSAVAVRPSTHTTRGPASINEQQVADSKKGSQKTAVVELPCNFAEQKHEVTSNYLRLSGQSCLRTKGVEILNKSNGFSATVIFGKNQKFTTDFIDLQEGANLIEITTSTQDGRRVARTIEVERRAPASDSSR